MNSFKLFLSIIFFYCPALLISQDTLTAFEKEKLRLSQLQTELLETRLSILESRLVKLTDQGYVRVLEKEVGAVRDEIRIAKDSLRILSDIVYALQYEIDKLVKAGKSGLKFSRPDISSVFGIQPIKLLQGNFEISAEQKFSNSWSGSLSVMGTYVTRGGIGGNYLKAQDLEYFSTMSDSWEKYTGEMFTGFGVELRFNNFLLNSLDSSEKAPLGLYAGPVFNYRYVRIRGEKFPSGVIVDKRKEFNRHLGVLGAGFILGYQFPVYKVLAVDLYVGGILRLSKYGGEKHLTRYKKWNNIDYSGVLPTAGIRISILK